jgi:hypothetical protein
MPTLIASLIGGLITASGTLVGRVLVSLGIGYVAFTGIGAMMDSVKVDVLGAIGSQGPLVASLAGVLQIGTCVNIIMSAITIKLSLMGLTSGTLTRMIQK